MFIIHDAFIFCWMDGEEGAWRQPVQNKYWYQSVPSSLGLCDRTEMLDGVPHVLSPCISPMGMHWSTASFLPGLHGKCPLEDPDTQGRQCMGGQSGQDHVCVTDRANDTSY